ncbi:unnamed protein product [Orchesella dallaii]|uniref:Nucleolar 27S pre-rRNA processing Urb2/Npa2 C-terminal domain-containing protein n=1 Tax=Orchesella dallaii TaxID=48710 RepID=A0ABP1QXZ8_9HEXA
MTLSKVSFVADVATEANMNDNNSESEDEVLDEEEKLIENEIEPPLKKIKRDLVKEAEEELIIHDATVKDLEIGVDEKFKVVSNFLNSLFENNINTLQFENNFAEWCKGTLLLLVDEVTETSEEYYNFLCCVLKVAPTIFESVCEKVLSVSFVHHRFSEECDMAYNVFMEKLANTFEKLRRFPKLIAKLLCCVRENIDKLNPKVDVKSVKRRKSNALKSFEVSIKFILSRNFISAYSSIVSLLPVGQIIDLWKTLSHNLEEECIKKFNSDTGDSSLYFLLSVVGELIVAFLNNIKVADYAVPSSTVEKVSEMMQKLKEHNLVQIGEEMSRTHDINCIRYFLKLSSAWGNLHQIMVLYSQNYRHDLPEVPSNFVEAEDLSLIFPYLSGDKWIALWKAIEKSEDTINTHLMVSLVALKLNWFAMIEQRQRESSEEMLLLEKDTGSSLDKSVKANLKRSTQATAKFVWNFQHLLVKGDDSCLNMSNESILHIASIYMDHEELVGHAKTYLESIILSHASLDIKVTQEVQRYSTITFHVALVMEALHEGLRQVEKMQVMKRRIKKFLHDFLSPDFKINVLQNITKHEKTASDELQKIVTHASEVVNDLMSMKLTKEEANDSSDRPPVLLKAIITFISQQELGQYPKPVKSMIFLGCAVIFIALIDSEDYKDIVEDLVVILNECGKKSQGNEFLFHVGWDNMFELIRRNVKFLSPESIKRMCSLILENVYISPKTTSQFLEKFGKVTCDDFELSTPLGQLSLAVMEYILQEVEDTKAKSTPLLLNHAKELTNTAVSKLSDGSVITELHSLIRAFKKQKKKGAATTDTATSISFVSYVMHTCYLLLKGKSSMSTEAASEYSVIVLPYLRFALDFLEAGKIGGYEKKKCDETLHMTTPLFNCRRFSIECLKSFEEFRSKLPDEFLLRMWNCCMMNLKMENDNDDKDFEKGLLKRIIEVANEEEFKALCDSIVQQLTNDSSELTLAASLLNVLMEAEIPVDNKKPRRMTVELCLHKYLEHISLWQESDEVIDIATPYIEFQTKLLRRRKPMGNLNTLAVSMLSITELPLTKVKNMKSFRSLFTLVCELLNALTVHRLDVISYRTHVFLQCFQFLVENLVKKADQTNKLTDGEIYDLRHCGHGIERICQSTKLGRQEFTRVSPYLVVVLLQQFEKITVYPAVKNPLLNGCYKLLDMCDDKGISHVNSMLSAGSREIFKTVYEMYKKFYRYKGKV